MSKRFDSISALNQRSQGCLPGLIGIEITSMETGFIASSLAIRKELMAPNGFLHAGTVVTLADTTCGYGTVANLPENARSFTTIELKSNFSGTVRDGIIKCEARLRHSGKTTQIWDAEVKNGDDKSIALFRCTQLLLYEK